MAYSLRSISTAKILHLLSEGEIYGTAAELYTGDASKRLESVYLNDTPIMNTDGSFNYDGLYHEMQYGTEDQEHMAGFPGTEGEAKKFNDKLDTTYIQKATSENDVDAVRLTVKTNQFFKSSKKGSIYGNSASFTVQVSDDAVNWKLAKSFSISGKTMSGYEQSHRIERPTKGESGVWYFRIRANAAPRNESRNKNEVFFNKYTEIKDVQEAYPNSAYIGLMYDAEAMGSAMPKTDLVLAGVKCKVPSTFTDTTFNPDGSVVKWGSYGTHTDPTNAFIEWMNAGATYKTVWTQDPAWILYDLLTNERYGVGSFVDANIIDQLSFFEYSFYNCGLVDDGIEGGGVHPHDQEPRFTFNSSIQKVEGARQVLQSICAMSRAYLYNAGGTIRVIQDRPTTPVANLSNANVVDGEFTYAGSPMEKHAAQINITFNDKNDRFLPATVTVSDFVFDEDNNIWRRLRDGEDITTFTTVTSRFGHNVTKIGAYGVTSEGQAIRQAIWAMDTNLNSGLRCSFKVGWSNATLEPGDVINISDRMLSDERMGGLVKNSTVDSLELDIPVVLGSHAYEILVYDAGDRLIDSKTINESDGTFTGVTLSGTFDTLPEKYSSWIIQPVDPSADGTHAKQYRILNITEDKTPGLFSIECTTHDPSKFARLEDGLIVRKPLFSNVGGNTVAPITNIQVTPEVEMEDDGTVISRNLRVSWDESLDSILAGYNLQWRANETVYVNEPRVSTNEYVIRNITFGVYDFLVSASNLNGVTSPRTAFTYIYDSENETTLEDLTNLRVKGGDDEFFTPDLTFTWDDPNIGAATEGSPDFDVVKDYKIEIKDSTTLEVVRTLFLSSNEYTYTSALIESDFGNKPRSIMVSVYVRNASLALSGALTRVLSNIAPALPTGISFVPFFNQYRMVHNIVPEIDASSLLIWHSKTSGFIPSDDNLIKDDVGTFHDVEADSNTLYYVRFAVYDTYSKQDLFISGEHTVTTLAEVQVITPDDPTGVDVTTSYTGGSSLVDITWDTALNASSYDIKLTQESTGAFSVSNTTDTTFGIDVRASTDFSVSVRARNDNAVSAWVEYANNPFTSAEDTVPPSEPVLNNAVAGIGAVSLQWTNPTDNDYSFTEVYYHTANDSGASSFYGSVSGGNLFVSPLDAGTTYYFWTKAVDESGNKSGFSNMESQVPLSVPVDIPDGSITATQIADDSISTPKLQALAVTANEIAANTITAGNIASNTITASEISSNAITTDELSANAVEASNIKADAITADKIATGAVTTDSMTANSIDGAVIAAGSIDADKITANSITASELATSELITNEAQLGSAVINSAAIKDAVIQSVHMGNASITSAKIGNFIESSNFDLIQGVRANGWQISGSQSGAGKIIATDIEIYNSDGALMLKSGTSPTGSLVTDVDRALDDAANAQSDAEAAQSTADTANSTANSAQTTASNAQNTATTANTNATNAQNDADTAQSTANTANSTANTAKTNAATAQSTADTAQSTADTANSTANSALSKANTALSNAATAQSTADGKIDTFYQTTAPTSASEGDLWFDTNDGNKIYTRRSGVWVNTQDSQIAAAVNNAQTAQTTADGKATTYYQSSTPSGASEGDLWVETDSGNRLRRLNSSGSWIVVQDSSTAKSTADTANSKAGAAQSTANTAINDAAAAALTAVWDSVSGTGKPANNATRNTGALADKNTVALNTGDTTGTLPSSKAGFNYAASGSKGGNASNADKVFGKSSTQVVHTGNKITSSNISTYISSLSVDRLQVKDRTITNTWTWEHEFSGTWWDVRDGITWVSGMNFYQAASDLPYLIKIQSSNSISTYFTLLNNRWTSEFDTLSWHEAIRIIRTDTGEVIKYNSPFTKATAGISLDSRTYGVPDTLTFQPLPNVNYKLQVGYKGQSWIGTPANLTAMEVRLNRTVLTVEEIYK